MKSGQNYSLEFDVLARNELASIDHPHRTAIIELALDLALQIGRDPSAGHETVFPFHPGKSQRFICDSRSVNDCGILVHLFFNVDHTDKRVMILDVTWWAAKEED